MITFLGDIALLNGQIKSLYKPEGDYVANFEYVCAKKLDAPTPGKINLSSPFHDFISLFGHNPVALVIANNHILDYGKNGFISTIEIIKKMGADTVGDKPFWYNNSTCILAYSLFFGEWQGCDIVQFTKVKAQKDINEAKANGARCIIVNMHWGVENYSLPDKDQKEIGHWFIDEGVDIVIGHHPHCVQPVEEYKKHYIFYSLGNCIFPPFNVPSHYDEKGISHRKYRFNWRRWNNKGLAVKYDETTKRLVGVDELFYKNDVLTCTDSNVHVTKYMSMNQKSTMFAKIQFSFRKYWLFFISNSFVDGKIFDFAALKSEIKK